MFGLDAAIAGLSHGSGVVVVLLIAVLLGLRHAADPDHLVAVSTLVATEPEDAARRASRVGLAWGLGHAATVLALGIPIVLFDGYLPAPAQRLAEVGVGLVIVALALRLLVRWRRGRYHVHEHAHDGLVHRHLHAHERPRHEHVHLARTPQQAFAVGLVHGAAGSAAIGVLLLASIPGRLQALAGLLLFAAATAASMGVLSLGLGYLLTRGTLERRVRAGAPALAALSLAFGAWYALASAAPLL